MQSLNEKLFHAVCKGKTGSVEKLLEQGANINVRDKKDGMTPLLKACQRRNYTMQKILLSNGANPKLKDKLGLSCLHYIAEAGDTESLKLLMAYHASIDSKDVNESTPLHYASDRNKLNAVDTLVFCGANAFEKNKRGITPLKSAKNPNVEQILKESELVLLGIKNGDINIESAELEPNKTYRLEKADLTIHTPSSFPLKSLSFICRRVRPEYCHPSLKPYQKELLISDTFEFLTSETQTKAKVVMEVPLYDFPDPFEDIYMKTDINPTIQPNMKQHDVKRSKDEKTPGRLKWICTTEVDVTHVRSFNLVAFPRKESFLVGRLQAELSSSVDKFIKISIQENTFTNPKGSISLEVIPTPVYTPDNIESTLCVGHFYNLTNDKLEQPQKTVNLRVPLPQDYEADGDIYLLGSDVDSDYYLEPDSDGRDDLDHWEVISVNPKITRGCVNIPVEHFSIYVASEAKRNISKRTVLSEASDLCRIAAQKRTFTVFLVLVKPVGSEVYKVVIECTTKRKKDDRMNYWINKNYLDQKPSHTGEFESIPGTKYILKLSGNVKTVTGFPQTRLEFHPKRENYQQFQVTMSDPTAMNFASVDIYEVKDNPDGKEVEEGLVAVAFRLTGTPFVEDIEPENDESFLGFTRDSLLRQLCKNMDDEWIKVAVLLGLSFRTVESYRTNSKLSTPDKKFKVMQLWRDTSKHRVDYGVDDLVSALHRINREDLVQIIQRELQIWLKNHSEKPDRFYKWTESKLTGPTFHSSDVEQPVPSSDQFFVLMIDKFGNFGNISQVGLHMGLSRPEADKIFNDALVTSREHQLLRMFVAAREKIGDMFKTFVQLIRSLEILNMSDAINWVTETAKEWLSNTEKDKNPVPWRQEIWHYLNKSISSEELDDNESNVGEVEGKQNGVETTEKENERAEDNLHEKKVDNSKEQKEPSISEENGSRVSVQGSKKEDAVSKKSTNQTIGEESRQTEKGMADRTHTQEDKETKSQTGQSFDEEFQSVDNQNQPMKKQQTHSVPEINLPVASELQDEFASKLSHKIVDEALESAMIRSLKTNKDISTGQHTQDTNASHSNSDVLETTNQNDIQQLRELLETNMETTTTSVDPSVASSHEHITDSHESKLDPTSSDHTDTSSKRSGEITIQDNDEMKSSKRKSDTEVSDDTLKDNNNTNDKTRFLDVLNQQLPSADSSDDSSTE